MIFRLPFIQLSLLIILASTTASGEVRRAIVI
jgi:hypothetical protein